ncbi:MAG: arsenite oxidase small subunit [Alphaproteobacteria bacterium 64-6]|nr:arsenate reductase (azurin) small subunit [Hyphomicrobium sp.]MBN9267614.1 arsenate reductase (azurin) small subunit [Hyphomicrobium sp.]ODT18589.1 MAG: arsenite oxidase small subunit [Hyphomicrobium sp. SCN 65-11]OJU28280.1 MAG: arsenite oxidase small subunit [Alphaproteobacteria bacterium 64-6]
MKGCDKLVDAGRRQFLRGSAMATAGAAATTVLPSSEAKAKPAPARVEYPSNRLANVSQLKPNEPLDIAYPDKSSPGVLIKLGTRVPGGVGPAGDIVAFSTLCPHKGFPLSYVAGEKTLTCPGHYSVFDCEKGGLQVMGQATQNLPQFMLRVAANGDIFAEGVDELIYGRLSNVL